MPESVVETIDLPLTSSLYAAIGALRVPRARPTQWLGTLRNLVQRGVSASELEWLGLLSHLEVLPATDPVTQADLLAYLRDTDHCRVTLKRSLSDAYAPTNGVSRI